MSYSIGGFEIVSMNFTRAWGMSPAGAQITAVGDGTVVVGGDAVLSIGGATFSGVLTEIKASITLGTLTSIQFVDNRIKLQQDDVYGLFNRIEVRPDNPATPGVDRQKRYVHILPVDWERQIVTKTEVPLTAAQILGYLVNAPTVRSGWGLQTHSLQSKPCREIDCLNGKKLANAIQEVTDAQGLIFTLVGENTLRWGIKGEENVPGFDAASTGDRASGAAVSGNDTQVRIVGDRNRYQELGIDLDPDWNRNYEKFWAEPAWMAEVAATFGGSMDTFSAAAALAAKARSVTVGEYAKKKGDSYNDRGLWGEVGRMEIPVWIYLQDIVFKAYRVPLGYEFNGIDRLSLELVEGLLANVEATTDGEMNYKSPREYYPDTKAYLILQGQQLSLIDPTKQRVITPEELGRVRELWQPDNRFNMDTRNKAFILEESACLPGSGDADLFVFPNLDKAGMSDALKYICVPNPKAVMNPAPCQVAVVWEAEKYFMDFGSGPRKGPQYVQGLSQHILTDGGDIVGEIPYADDEVTNDKAEKVASAYIARQSVYQSGGYKRIGNCGTALTSAIDRVTINLDIETGITETVEFSKERGPSNFEPERDLERRQRARDLFPGQWDLKRDVVNLNYIAKITKELKRSPIHEQSRYASLNDVLEKPVGVAHPATKKIFSPDEWLAGQPVFIGADDKPDPSGTRFAGVVICDSQGMLPCATQGIVPVRCKGPFKANDSCGIDTGKSQVAKKDGKLPLGQFQADYAGSETILAPVRLGAGSSPIKNEYSFQLFYAPDDKGKPRLLVVDGKINDEYPDGMDLSGDLDKENNFYLTLPENFEDDIFEVYAQIEYGDPADPATPAFDIKHRYIKGGKQDDTPDTEYGKLIVIIGYGEIDRDDDGKIVTVMPHNQHCGDINFTFDFGGLDGQPALKCTPFDEWVELPVES